MIRDNDGELIGAPPAPDIPTQQIPEQDLSGLYIEDLHIELPKIEPPAPPLPAPYPVPAAARRTWTEDLWNLVSRAAGELIADAEVRYGVESGKKKKAWVRMHLLSLLHKLEERYDRVPGALEGVAFWVLGQMLDRIIERVFRELDRSGVVNMRHRAA